MTETGPRNENKSDQHFFLWSGYVKKKIPYAAFMLLDIGTQSNLGSHTLRVTELPSVEIPKMTAWFRIPMPTFLPSKLCMNKKNPIILNHSDSVIQLLQQLTYIKRC